MKLFTRIAKAGKGYNPNRDADGQFASGATASKLNDVLSGKVKPSRKLPQPQVGQADWEAVTGMNEVYTELEGLGMKRHQSTMTSLSILDSGEVVENADNPYHRTGYIDNGNAFAHAVNHLRKRGFERAQAHNPQFRGTVLERGPVRVVFSSGFGGSHHVSFETASKYRKVNKAGGYNPNRAAGGRFGSGAGGPTAGGKGKKPGQPEKPGSVADHMDLKKLGGAGHKLLDRMVEYMESDEGSDLESMHQGPRVKKLHKLTEKVAELSDKAVAGELKPGEATKLVTSLRESVKLFRQIKGGKR